MRSQLPNLYRSLERGGAANGYDAIAMAATLNFLSIHSPSKRQEDAYTRLLEPLWVHLGEDSRAHIHERLAVHHTIPAALEALISNTPAPVSQPVAEDASRDHCAPMPTAPQPVSMEDLSILADQREPGVEPQRAAVSADDARTTLRALVAAPASRPKAQKRPIIQIAQTRNRTALRDYLADNLSLSLTECEKLLDPDNLPELAGALKALGLSTPDAMTVLIFVDETVSTNIATFAIAKNHYEQLSPVAAASRFSKPAVPVLPSPSLQPATADLQTPNRSTSPRRASFGRRGANQNRRTGTRD